MKGLLDEENVGWCECWMRNVGWCDWWPKRFVRWGDLLDEEINGWRNCVWLRRLMDDDSFRELLFWNEDTVASFFNVYNFHAGIWAERVHARSRHLLSATSSWPVGHRATNFSGRWIGAALAAMGYTFILTKSLNSFICFFNILFGNNNDKTISYLSVENLFVFTSSNSFHLWNGFGRAKQARAQLVTLKNVVELYYF